MYNEETTFLALPGPVEIHPRVYRAMNKRLYGHRTSHFKSIYDDCAVKFAKTIKTDRDIQFHAGSGSLGLHAAITNTVTKNDTVINCINGKFGERVEKITTKFAGSSKSVKAIWGKAIKPEMVKKALEENPDTILVTITHNETSTGVLNPLSEISKIVQKHGALLMADCITSAGGDIVEMDKWGIDIFVSGSQKCYGLPPGLAFIALSTKAEKYMETVSRDQDFYSDLVSFSKSIVTRDPPFTPALGLMYGLQESLNLIFEEGLENRIARHRKMAKLYRNAITSIGLSLFAEEGYRSNTLTTALLPKNTDWKVMSQTMLENGVLIAGGQNEFKGKIFRFGHMNMVGPRELLMVMSLVELSLFKAGANINLGEGVKSIQLGLLG